MAEKQILFSAPMVKAILDGSKTMTRRVVKNDARCPYESGDLLWVRETFWLGHAPNDDKGQGVARYADHSFKPHPDLDHKRITWCRKWTKKPSIFMPRWASRITLRVTEVRAERLQEMKREDATAEGIGDSPLWRPAFKQLWDSINAERGYSWDANPRVWVVSFERI